MAIGKARNYQAVSQINGACICVTSSVGLLLLVDDFFCSMLGYSREQLLGHPVSAFFSSQPSEDGARCFSAALSGECDEFRWHGAHKNGASIEFFTSLKRITLRNRRPLMLLVSLEFTPQNPEEGMTEAAQKETERLSRVSGQVLTGVLVTDDQGFVEWTNADFSQISGFSLGELKGQKPSMVLQGAETKPELVQHMSQCLKSGQGFHVDIVNYHKSHYAYWVQIDCAPLLDSSKEIQGFIALHRDISDQMRTSQLLHEQNHLFHSIIETMNDGVITTDQFGSVLSFNTAAEAMFQYSRPEILGQNIKLLMPDDYAAHHDGYLTSYRQTSQGNIMGRSRELAGKRKDGSVFPLELSVTETVKNGEPLYVGLLRDITARKAYEHQIEQLAFKDTLTQVANRRLFDSQVQHHMAVTDRTAEHCALFFLDVDNFKAINDTLGHVMGDQLLIQIAQTLEVNLHTSDTVARLGGDEFVIVLANLSPEKMTAAKQAETVAKRLLEKLAQPFGNAEFQHHVKCSLGAVLFTGESVDINELMRQSDIAMYNAKRFGTSTHKIQFFDPQMQAELIASHRMESELRKALYERELEPYFQAQVDAEGGLVGAEVLIRWNHPTRGLLAPAAFIDVAERSGLIVAMGYQVFAMACEKLVVWSRLTTAAQITLAVNVSARQFEEPDFVHRVTEILSRTGANPGRLKLEITETTLAKNIDSVSTKMQALKKLGVNFSMDDFGTGYSSLTYLKRLPITQLKIDKSFVRELLDDRDDQVITAAIISLTETLGIEVIAEGVETPEHRDLLLTMGCRHFQGYFFGKPEPASVFESRFDGQSRFVIIESRLTSSRTE